MNWTNADSVLAHGEGWDIFECSGSSAGDFQIQKFDDPDEWISSGRPYPFRDDTDVWRHVSALAAKGSALHVRALEFLRENNPQEVEAIEKFIRESV
ncbi:hypothetical protein BEN60_gp052 [Gordonia phage Smoothie]|uniref:Uncharacterized protein n=1 Tax=Gordonia phage Smoothie TaxID=1838078 RepID=A0A160DEI6_9CAUD|nr:hypothetical protein BEN60_gp052 [Gordonia phage Smoothie]ANA86310.1 hypothetical protein PBI_SMOOTHIE_155 [Gordonia phage Smoothie]